MTASTAKMQPKALDQASDRHLRNCSANEHGCGQPADLDQRNAADALVDDLRQRDGQRVEHQSRRQRDHDEQAEDDGGDRR
jgi:hypothetical protein